MKLKKDEEQLLEIKQIKDIESIELKDIYLSVVNGKRFLVPGFIVTYGEPSKIIFLTTQDKYFEEFVRKIKEVYLEEKDHVIREGIMGKEYIKIDPVSKNILLNGNLEELSEMYKYYQGQEGFKDSLLFEEDRFKAKFSMIEYHLQQTTKRFGLSIGEVKLSEGVNGVYYLTTTIQNKPTILPVYYEEDGDNWHVEISNIVDNAIPLHMEGSFTKDGLNVHCFIDEYKYYDYTTYTYKRGHVVMEREVYYQNDLVHWKEEEIPTTEETSAARWASIDGEKNLEWYALPWNSFYGVKVDNKCLEEDGTLTDGVGPERLMTTQTAYVSPTQHSVFVKERATKRYYKKKDDRIISQNVLLDDVNKTTIGTIQGDKVLLETTFAKQGPNGFYKEHLAGQHFYQVSDKDLTKSKMRFIGRKDGIEEASDLIDGHNIQKGK